MSPETLIGMELGNSVLQRLLGQGTMGAVYLATQGDREVAVKVFLPASVLEQADREEFLKRLERTIAHNAVLDHPHILPILGHGRQADLVYQIAPAIAGESLAALLARAGALPFVQIQLYLEQLAAALDYAHACGILHSDIKAGNILLPLKGGLLLTDFGLGRLTVEKNFALARRAQPGMLDALPPEYVLGKTIDPRSDLYSLGVVLYQMVTGSPPFKGNSLGEVAMQHVKAAPPAPRLLRTDLPEAAEQALLRVLAKDPTRRYSCASELASAFCLALAAVRPGRTSPGAYQETNALDLLADLASSGKTTALRSAAPRTGGLFDPKWQSQRPSIEAGEQQGQEADTATTAPQAALFARPKPTILAVEQLPDAAFSSAGMNFAETAGLANPEIQPGAAAEISDYPYKPPVAPSMSRANGNNLSRNDLLPPVNDGYQISFAGSPDELEQKLSMQEPDPSGSLQLVDAPAGNTEAFYFAQQSVSMFNTFNPLPGGNGDTTGTPKLTEPVKIVQVPVAGQPGHFMTGYLPVLPREQATKTASRGTRTRMKLVSLLLVLLVIGTGSGIFLVTRTHNGQAITPKSQATPNATANASAQATATADANIILSDTLSQNINDWPVGQQGWFTCTFEDNAYHITNNDKTRSASALLQKVIGGPFAYSLTTEQIKGDETSPNNQFGMILYATIQNTADKQIDKFYTFEILNKASGLYQFWKYDNSKSGNPWSLLWSKKFGKEFHQGGGPSHVNTLKVTGDGKVFTFIVNGKQVGTWKDSSFSSGEMGMLVNLNGAEVAFSHFLLSHS